MKRVLFVEPSPEVTAQLQSTLKFEAKQWDLVFAQNGEQAIEALGGQPLDVVVSEKGLPGMDGLDLLAKVMERQPESIRMCVSDDIDSRAMIKAATVVHQFLSKPYDMEGLRVLINRALAIREHLSDCRLRKQLHKIGGLPSLPVLYSQVVQEMQSPDPSVARVAEIIEKDVGMSTKLLRIVNSAGVGLRNPVSNITHAASLLGLNKLKSMVLMVEVFTLVEQKPILGGFSLAALWDHSLRVGEFAKKIAQAEVDDAKIIDDSFMSGLLHDIGLIILATAMPDELNAALAKAKSEGISLFQAERDLLNATHAEVGGYLLELWGMPDAVVVAIAFHDYPSGVPEEGYPSGLPEHGFTPLTAVHVANYFCEDDAKEEYGYPTAEADTVHLDVLGFTARIGDWWDACHGED